MVTSNVTDLKDDHRLTKINDLCLKLLTRREHSQQELLNKLHIKGYSRTLVLPIITKLAEQNWQSDQRYAEHYIRHCVQKGYGPIYISYKLRQNGINIIELDDIVQSIISSWQTQLQQVYTHKYNDSPVVDKNEWARRSRFLLQRGFSGAMISDLFNDLNRTTQH